VGYGIPLGGLSGVAGDDLSASVSGTFPLQVEAGWRFTPHLYAGAYFQYAFASLASSQKAACDANGVSCSASQLRFGVDLVYTILPRAVLAPWVGVGAGYEIAKVGISLGGLSTEVTYRGFEFAHFMAGLDYRLWPSFRIGPFVTFTLGQFSTFESPSVTTDPITGASQIGPSQSVDIQQKALHEWLQLGLKATYDF